jgi:hypothetical protein
MSDLKRIEDKIDRLDEKLASVNVTLSSQHVVLSDHIRRTELLEAAIEPMKERINKVQGVIQFIVFLSVIATIVVGVVEAIKLVGHS